MNLDIGIEGSEFLYLGQSGRPMAILLQGPSGGEKDTLFLQYVAAGLKAGEGTLVVLASKSPRRFLKELSKLGLDAERALADGLLRLVDWYSHREENVTNIEEQGPLLRVPADLHKLSEALGRVLVRAGSLMGGRAALDFLSPALATNPASEVIPLAASARALIQTFGMAGLFIVDKDLHDEGTLEALRLNMETIVDLERRKEADKVVRRISVIRASGKAVDGITFALEVNREGLMRVQPPSVEALGAMGQRLEEMLKENPTDGQLWTALGQNLRARGELERAERCFRAALKLTPYSEAARLLEEMLKGSAVPAAPPAYAAPAAPPPPPKPASPTASKTPPSQPRSATPPTPPAPSDGGVREREDKLPCMSCGTHLEAGAELCYVCGATISRADKTRIKIRNLLESCEQRLGADPNNADAWFVKAAALGRFKDYRGAVEALNRLTRVDPRYPGMWVLKAKLYARLGNENMARLCRRRAQEMEGTPAGVEPPTFFEEDGEGEPRPNQFQCPVCGRWLSMEASSCPCGAQFEKGASFVPRP